MHNSTKRVSKAATALAVTVPLAELAIAHSNVDKNWPSLLQDLEFYLWPTQLALMMVGNSNPVAVTSREHILSVCFGYLLAFGGNILLYNAVGLILWKVAALGKRYGAR